MSASLINRPSVEVIIEGLIAMFIDKEGEQVVGSQLGVLVDAPGHEFTIEVKEILGGGNPPIPPRVINLPSVASELRLDAQDTGETGIRFAGPYEQINRETRQGDLQTFNWVLDFEGDELYGFDIGVKREGFSPILRLNNGEFFTKVVSINKLLIRRETEAEPVSLGHVATQIGFRINLDRPESKALFLNGEDVVFEARPGQSFEITLKNVPVGNHEGHSADHANFYYNALGQKIPRGEKRLFSSTELPPGPLPPVSPEAACLPGFLSGSKPGGGS